MYHRGIFNTFLSLNGILINFHVTFHQLILVHVAGNSFLLKSHLSRLINFPTFTSMAYYYRLFLRTKLTKVTAKVPQELLQFFVVLGLLNMKSRELQPVNRKG